MDFDELKKALEATSAFSIAAKALETNSLGKRAAVAHG